VRTGALCCSGGPTRRLSVVTEALRCRRTFLDTDPLGCVLTHKTERETGTIRIPMSGKDMMIMKKRYLIAGAVILGLLVTPVVALALSTSPVSTPGTIPTGIGHEGIDDMHDSVWNGDGTGDECTDEMHEAMWGADGAQVDEWMDEMHDSVWNGDGTGHEGMDEMHESMWGADGSGHGSMMGSGYRSGSASGHGNGGGMRGGR